MFSFFKISVDIHDICPFVINNGACFDSSLLALMGGSWSYKHFVNLYIIFLHILFCIYCLMKSIHVYLI